jgi:aryl-alcohol dehydrogenase-like predicted oxidoreductase
VLIATKVGNPMAPDKSGLRADYIARAVDDSLRRLQTDYIDLYQSHNPDPATPIEETLGAYARLIEQGKVRRIGASNHDAPTLAAALAASDRHGLPRYTVVQPLYNLCDRDKFEGALADLCATEGLGVINYYALASGFLTGKYRNEKDLAGSSRAGSNKKYLNARGLRILAALDAVAAQLRAKPGQVALAWLIANPRITAPIASATSLAQLDEMIAAAQLVLPADAMALLERASAPDAPPA